MTEPVKPTKSPAQAEKESLQKEYDDAVKLALEVIAAEIVKLPEGDIETRAALYRSLLSIKDTVAQCGPEVRKAYNKAVDAMFSDMDAIPSSMYLGEEDPRP